jgi:competence protein ComEC
LLEHRGPSINVLAVAAALGLAAAPAAVFDAGFILSFGATLGILIGVPRLLSLITWSQRARSGTGARRGSTRTVRPVVPPPLAALARAAARHLALGVATVVAATIAAEVALAPVGAALFGRVTCAGLLLNLAAIPLMTIVQAASLAALAAWLVDADLARACGYVVHVAARGLVDSARLVDVVPWLSRELAPPSFAVLSGYYGALAVALYRRRAARRAGVMAALFGAIIVIGPHPVTHDAVPRAPGGVLRFVFLDVGQGDATLVIVPDGRAFLVDAGGLPAAPLQDPTDGPAFDIGERVLARALRAFGVRSLDTFVVTHGDPDHIGGARSVIRGFRPRAIWEGVPVPPHDPLRWLAEAGDRIAAEWRTVQAGDSLRVAHVGMRALHPPRPEWERQRVRNDDSIVLDIRLGGVSVILPGDIGREGESRARTHLAPAATTVLKAPHHGSATSSTREFVEALRPAVVIVSAGRNNRFGHPAPAVLARYRAVGAKIFSTADDGAVILDTDGETVEIRTWSGRRVTLGRTEITK